MSSEADKRLVAALYDTIILGAFDELAQFCHDDFGFCHQVDTPQGGVAGFVASEKMSVDAFNSWSLSIQDRVATNDEVAVRRPMRRGDALHQVIASAPRRLFPQGIFFDD
ncbi:MAG: ester cyclase [bacterium]|nr:ester cyclase [bacterium]